MNNLTRRLRKLEAAVDLPNLRWKCLTGTQFADWPELDQTDFIREAAKLEPSKRTEVFQTFSDADLDYIIALLRHSLDADTQGSAATV